MIRLVVFDCDGTLVDGQYAIIEAMRRSFLRHRLAPPPAAAVRRVVGLALPSAIARLWPDGDNGVCEGLVRDYRTEFATLRSDPAHREPLYPGAAKAIAGLAAAGYRLGMATGKSRRGLRATLERCGLYDRFVTLQTADDAPSKPHPGMLERAMSEAGVAVDETAHVGDTTFDVEMAINAGVAALGVSWGYHEAEELAAAGAHAVIDSFAELPGVLASLAGAPRG
ncbi:MAG: HAD-IA family hydrolase [Alphaproteobacteria bacterium]